MQLGEVKLCGEEGRHKDECILLKTMGFPMDIWNCEARHCNALFYVLSMSCSLYDEKILLTNFKIFRYPLMINGERSLVGIIKNAKTLLVKELTSLSSNGVSRCQFICP